MHYIIANNPQFDISKATERLREGDTLIHLNAHIFWGRLSNLSIHEKCFHEIFFNFKMWGIGPYRRHAGAFSKVYWASRHRDAIVPGPYRFKTLPKIIKERGLEAASEVYFQRKTNTIIQVPYTSTGSYKWSVGHKALRYLLESMEPQCIKLAGFTFRGWGGHPWFAEEQASRKLGVEIIT